MPDLNEKWTQPPKPYTEATLLRAMETAGKLVDNDELRDALKKMVLAVRQRALPLSRPCSSETISVRRKRI